MRRFLVSILFTMACTSGIAYAGERIPKYLGDFGYQEGVFGCHAFEDTLQIAKMQKRFGMGGRFRVSQI